MSVEDFLFGIKRRRSRHKRILNAEREFHYALLNLGPSDVTIDCGANVGLYTRFLARTGAQVHAFEPDPIAFEELQKNTSSLRNVTLHKAAVGVNSGEVNLYRKRDSNQDPLSNTVSSSIISVPAIQNSCDDTVRVSLVSLRDFVASLGRQVSLMKMDIEGAELDILESFIEDGSATSIPRAFIETHERSHPHLTSRTFKLVRYAKKNLPGWNFDWA